MGTSGRSSSRQRSSMLPQHPLLLHFFARGISAWDGPAYPYILFSLEASALLSTISTFNTACQDEKMSRRRRCIRRWRHRASYAPTAATHLLILTLLVESDERVYCLSKAEASRERRI